MCCLVAHCDVGSHVTRALFFRESIDLLKENFRDELKKDGARVPFYLRPCYLFALTSFSIPDWKLVVKLKGLLNISGP